MKHFKRKITFKCLKYLKINPFFRACIAVSIPTCYVEHWGLILPTTKKRKETICKEPQDNKSLPSRNLSKWQNEIKSFIMSTLK